MQRCSTRPASALALALLLFLAATVSACGEDDDRIVSRAPSIDAILDSAANRAVDVTLPTGERGHWPPLPTHTQLAVHVSRDGVFVEGERVVELVDGRVPESAHAGALAMRDGQGQAGRPIVPLVARLDALTEPLRVAPTPASVRLDARIDAAGEPCVEPLLVDGKPVVLVPWVDADVPYATLLDLSASATAAGLTVEGPVAMMPGGASSVMMRRPHGRALYPLPVRCTQGPAEPPGDEILVHIGRDRVTVRGERDEEDIVISRRPDVSDALVWRALYNAVQSKARSGRMATRSLGLTADADVPLGDVLRAADAVAFHRAPADADRPRAGRRLERGTLASAEVVRQVRRVPHTGAYIEVPSELRRARISLHSADAAYAASP